MDNARTQPAKSGQIETTTNKNQLAEDEEMIIEASEELEVVKTFDELGLREELLRGNNNKF